MQQLSAARRPNQGDSQETRTLLSRAVNAEKRLNVVQNQLLQTEEKITTMNQRTTTADAKWEARVKEYEARLKAGEEKYKRERQGNKERILELETQIKSVLFLFSRDVWMTDEELDRSLERQTELALKRNAQLDNVAEVAKAGSAVRSR